MKRPLLYIDATISVDMKQTITIYKTRAKIEIRPILLNTANIAKNNKINNST